MNRRSLLKLLGAASVAPSLPAKIDTRSIEAAHAINVLTDPGCALPVNAPGFFFARLFVQSFSKETNKAIDKAQAVGDWCDDIEHCPSFYKDPLALETAEHAIIRFHNPLLTGIWGKPDPAVILRLSFLVQYRDGHGYMAASWLGKNNRYWDL